MLLPKTVKPVKKYENYIILNGRTYFVQVVDGVRLIDGMTTDEFMDQADPMTMLAIAFKGRQILEIDKK